MSGLVASSRGGICVPDVKIVKGRLKSLALRGSPGTAPPLPLSLFPSKLKKMLFLGLTGERIEVGICPPARAPTLPSRVGVGI